MFFVVIYVGLQVVYSHPVTNCSVVPYVQQVFDQDPNIKRNRHVPRAVCEAKT